MIGLNDRILMRKKTAESNGLLGSLDHCWEFNETSGTTVSDVHGSNDGTASNSSILNNTGLLDKAVKFDAAGEHIELTNAIVYNPLTESYSYNFWVKGTSPSPVSAHPYILYNSPGLAGKSYSVVCAILYNNSDELNMFIYDGSSQVKVVIAGSKIWDGDWHMITFVASHADEEIRAYLDGVLEDTTAIPYTSFTLTSANYYKQISKAATLTNRTAYVTLDQLAVWNKALTANDITKLYNSGYGLAYSGWTT